MIQFKAKTTNGEIINSALSEFTFPAGEVHIKMEDQRDLEQVEIAIIYADKDIHKDLFMLQAWDNLIERQAKGTYRVAVIPYFPGARADHNYPKTLDIYAGVLASTQIDEVVIFDPHSSETVKTLEKLPELKVTVYYPTNALSTLANRQVMPHLYSYVIAPDAGAVNRAQKVADMLDVKLYRATKKRDQETGKLSGFEVEKLPLTGRGLVVDDICDGGGTFAGLMEVAKQGHHGPVDLYVSHGVFSGAALELLPKYFDNIFTTNSYNPRRNLQFRTYGGRALTPETAFKRLDVISFMLAGIDREKALAEKTKEFKIDFVAFNQAVQTTPLGQRMPKQEDFKVQHDAALQRSATTNLYRGI